LFADTNLWQELLTQLSLYQGYAYPVLFLGAFFETLIPFSFIVYGEVFFLAGAVLAGAGTLDIRVVAAVLYAGGILGDSCSYLLGRRYGMGLFSRLSSHRITSCFIRAGMRERGEEFFTRWGASAVFLARLCGPFSWFVPAFAGVFKLDYRKFVLFNTLGVMIGIGQFLVVGYLLGNNLDTMYAWLSRLGYIPALILCIVLLVLVRRRLTAQQARKKAQALTC